jgi:hypothetical protein
MSSVKSLISLATNCCCTLTERVKVNCTDWLIFAMQTHCAYREVRSELPVRTLRRCKQSALCVSYIRLQLTVKTSAVSLILLIIEEGRARSNHFAVLRSGCPRSIISSGQQMELKKSHFQFRVILRPTVSRPVCPGIRPPLGTREQFIFFYDFRFSRR